MDESQAANLRRFAFAAEQSFDNLHDTVAKLAVTSVHTTRCASRSDAVLGLAQRTDEAITAAYAAIHDLRKLADHAKWIYRDDDQKDR